MATSHSWAFRASFRRHAFGWRGTRNVIERLNEAVSEIERMARTDPALAGEGAVLLLEKLSPAVSDIDSSSGALGNATAGVVEKMAPLIAAAATLASHWADQLLPLVHHVMPDRRNGTYAYAKSGTLCFGALFHAGRFDVPPGRAGARPQAVLA